MFHTNPETILSEHNYNVGNGGRNPQPPFQSSGETKMRLQQSRVGAPQLIRGTTGLKKERNPNLTPVNGNSQVTSCGDVGIIDCKKNMGVVTVTSSSLEHGCILRGGYQHPSRIAQLAHTPKIVFNFGFTFALCDPHNMHSSVSPTGPTYEFPLSP